MRKEYVRATGDWSDVYVIGEPVLSGTRSVYRVPKNVLSIILTQLLSTYSTLSGLDEISSDQLATYLRDLPIQDFTNLGIVNISPNIAIPDSQYATPGTTAFEALAFADYSFAGPIGTKAVAWFGSNNIDVGAMMTNARNVDGNPLNLQGEDAGHSYQFHLDAAQVRPFWSQFMVSANLSTQL